MATNTHTEVSKAIALQLESVRDMIPSRKSLPSGAGKRIAFYSHDTLGLGHLRRTLKIARSVTELFPEISALIISGSPDTGLVTNQLASANHNTTGIDVVKLPSVKKVDSEQYAARFLPDDIERLVAMRSAIVLSVIKTFEPHLLLVDHAPIGMCGELAPTFQWLEEKSGATKLAYGMRDIIDDPKVISKRWKQNNIYSVLENTYDAILIYGDPRLAATVTNYNLPEAVLEKTNYCGYIGDVAWRDKTQGVERESAHSNGKKLVIVTIGGGDYYGPEIIGAYLQMIEENKSRITFESVLITGPLLDPKLFRAYKALAESLPVTIHSSVNRIPELLCASDLLITTAGYNSAVDALSYASSALMAPRMSMRKEQILRAQSLSEIGAVEIFDPHQTSSQKLFEKVTRLLNRKESPLTKSRAEDSIDLDGNLRAAAICGRIMELIP